MSKTATKTAVVSGEQKLHAAQKPASLDVSTDWIWTYQEEPHRTRRHQIIKAHPEVTKLCGHEPLTKWVVLLVVSIQVATSYFVRDYSPLSWQFLLAAYVIGATANQNLFLAIHEISHNLAFRSPILNRLLAIVANLPIGIPYSASFRPYHLIHHKALGVEGLDTDLPTRFEAIFLDSVLGKAFFATFQIFFYALRPMMVFQIPMTKLHLLNVIVQIAFDVVIYKTMGGNALMYFLISAFLAGSLHPCAGHFIAEHYIFEKHLDTPTSSDPNILAAETYSYYGPLNFFTYNVGYHNEHHDFPAIPWSRLHKLKTIAAEFYDPLPYHSSWSWVIWEFITSKDLSLWSRVKREQSKKVTTAAWTKEEIGDVDEVPSKKTL
ncbi:fatty acid desaturase-domain-containing protein [Peziza echinospora]|nr:fatty acid desaturase-domain-containing protein [Peziza echinospora]